MPDPVERHYTTEQVRDLLGYAHVNDVYRLIESKDLLARRRTRSNAGRGKTGKAKPHWIVPASSLRAYLEGLETNRDGRAASPAKPAARRRGAMKGVRTFI